jgi:hypothetical protein
MLIPQFTGEYSISNIKLYIPQIVLQFVAREIYKVLVNS